MNDRQYESLTPTERRVLRLVHHTRKSDVVASMAGMSRHTVDQHIKSARAKLGNVGRYVAADMLRAFEATHPLSLGNPAQGMVQPINQAPPMLRPAGPAEPMVAEERTAFEGLVSINPSGQADHLEEWLQERSMLSRFVLVLAAAFLLLLLIISAPLLAERMGRIGHLLYG
ncbi:helix-turn-helix transcriptional regulator [Sphingomonas sp. SORGH_AS_0879]|uniref:helix-turn-helix transcriptional regulator n=1 Tax=Sphingomonas sp. SORGH_AS_0879 TaxID=3041790 RepID=UPI002787F466|nr:helix-turn-helix transcriptional regulator [Sphingomonas sp. SORGH_AS_0879]MDQ1232146.1 DNA-binding CsgD family transcriptional regulator [Sphingomonas sp. SORGH_AS_0879]